MAFATGLDLEQISQDGSLAIVIKIEDNVLTKSLCTNIRFRLLIIW